MKTVLIIDDQPSILLTLGWLLESQGYRVLTANAAREAEAMFSTDDFDIAIIDHGLEEVDGVELARRLKAVRAVPVIMLSGNPDLNPPSEVVDLFLAKPHDPKKLLAAVATLIGPGSPKQE